MFNEEIVYRLVYDNKGAFTHLELVEGVHHVNIIFSEGLHPNSHRWEEIRDTTDRIAEKVREQSQEEAR